MAHTSNSLSSTSVIMGMGITGIACLRFFIAQQHPVCIMDSRIAPANLAMIQDNYPEIPIFTGGFDCATLCAAKEIIISPGLAADLPELQQAREAGVPIISEIEVFLRHVDAPVIAITGSNGKSTVTTLLGDMANNAGLRVGVGGNLGIPALDLLTEQAPCDAYILELSSFQLETTYDLSPHASVVLNISEDHMDRYPDLAAYAQTKARVYQTAKHKVINEDDPCVKAMCQQDDKSIIRFSTQSDQADFHLLTKNKKTYLAYQGTALLETEQLYVQGKIMQANALAALALAHSLQLPLYSSLQTLTQFKGLLHRCQWVRNYQGVDWFNDSKGTNVGASIAAIEGLERPKKIVLIAGGQAKGADFSPLIQIAQQYLKACIVIGEDAQLIANTLGNSVQLHHADSLEAAILQATTLTQTGDAVLLSPACASFDMFTGYVQRGEAFVQHVQAL